MSAPEPAAEPGADRDGTSSFEVATTGGRTLRAVVRGGGVPTPEQTAAIAAVLVTAGGADSPSVPTSGRPDWQTAALREGVGAARIADRTDLRRPHGPV